MPALQFLRPTVVILLLSVSLRHHVPEVVEMVSSYFYPILMAMVAMVLLSKFILAMRNHVETR